MDSRIKDYKNKEKKIYKELDELYDMLEGLKEANKNTSEISKKIEIKEKELDEFIDSFSKVIFDEYSPKKPNIYDKENKKVIAWSEMFCNRYEDLSKIKKKILTRLFDKDFELKLK